MCDTNDTDLSFSESSVVFSESAARKLDRHRASWRERERREAKYAEQTHAHMRTETTQRSDQIRHWITGMEASTCRVEKADGWVWEAKKSVGHSGQTAPVSIRRTRLYLSLFHSLLTGVSLFSSGPARDAQYSLSCWPLGMLAGADTSTPVHHTVHTHEMTHT